MARNDPHFRLRLPADLKERIEKAAQLSGRSINAEIVRILSIHYPTKPPVEEVLKRIENMIDIMQGEDRLNVASRANVIEVLDELKDVILLDEDQYMKKREEESGF